MYFILKLFIWSYFNLYIESFDFLISTFINSYTGYLYRLRGNIDFEYKLCSYLPLSFAIFTALYIKLSIFSFFYFLKAIDIYSTEFILHSCYSNIATKLTAIQIKYSGQYGFVTKKSRTLNESYLFSTSVINTNIIGFNIAPKL